MSISGKLFRLASVAIVVAVATAGGVRAQDEISDSHLKAARVAISSLRVTDEFDGIISAAAAQLKVQLYQKNPDLQPLISIIVDETALSLAPRRADLERESALAYAKAFSEAELNSITEFYTGSVGKKLLIEGPVVTRELFKAADIWRGGIARDLALEAGKKIDEEVAKLNGGGGTQSE